LKKETPMKDEDDDAKKMLSLLHTHLKLLLPI
jgi:hypothetical protein